MSFAGRFVWTDRAPRLEAHAGDYAATPDGEVEVLVWAVGRALDVLGAYMKKGEACVEILREPFALAVVDRRKGTAFLWRDRLGFRPLYWAQTKDGAAFATTVQATWTLSGLERAFDPEGLRHFFFGVGRLRHTLFAGVRRVAPGCVRAFRDADSKETEYWDVPFPAAGEHPVRDADAAARSLFERLDASIDARLVDRDPAIQISGGLDSAAVAFRAVPKRKMPAYGITFTKPEYRRLDESDKARRVCAELGLEYRPYDYDASAELNDGFLDTVRAVEMPVWNLDGQVNTPFRLLLRAIARRGHDGFFTGVGSDEILGGYLHYKMEKLRARRCAGLLKRAVFRLEPTLAAVDAALAAVERRWGHPLSSLSWLKNFEYLEEQFPKWMPGAGRGTLDLGVDPGKYAGLDAVDRAMYLDLKTRYPDFVLLGEHQLAAANGLHSRAPFADGAFVAWAAGVDPRLKLRGLMDKYVLKKAVNRYLPMAWFNRDKRGFNAPIDREVWRNRESRLVRSLLSEKALKDVGIFDASQVHLTLVEHFEQAPDETTPGRMFLLERALTLQAVHRVFLGSGSL